ncbi:hypothetical protein WA026_002174 [Henosepilachna vigintioctopunctata]|uniref:BSD domain-containing protein n=1 Tax=Henosepilachna vigintioctopunctata TaxID=420089 RepID=A0AAW1U025_9CUCU
MAESNDNNWLGSWFTAAKDKLKNSEVLGSVCKDLEEFGGAVTKGATSVISSTGSVLEKTLSLDSPDSAASTVKKSFSTFLDQVNTVLNPSPDDSETEAILIIEDSETVTLSKLQQIIYDLQMNEKTFTMEPEAHLCKQYECWLEIIEDQVSDDRIEKYLKTSDVLRRQYDKLVPDQVDKDSFWKRYLFKKALIEDEIAHQELQEKRELKENERAEEAVGWEEEFAGDIELTEEQQIKLLEEYEKETKSKKTTSPMKKSSNSSSSINSPTQKTKVKQNTVSKEDAAVSLETTSSSSSIDDDWEKVTEVEK